MDCAFGHLTLGGPIGRVSHRPAEEHRAPSQELGPAQIESGATALPASCPIHEHEPATPGVTQSEKTSVTVRRRKGHSNRA